MKSFPWLLPAIVVMTGLAVTFVEPLRIAVRDNNPLGRVFWIAFLRSDLCPFSEAWQGLGEYRTTQKAVAWAARNSRLRSTTAAGLQEWETPFGIMWFPGAAEPWTVHFLLAQYKVGAYPGVVIHPGDTVVDCGGYIGDWAKWSLRAGASRVIVFEPAADQRECIRLNLAAELRQGKVVLYEKGVWDREERLYLNRAVGNPAANAVTNQQGPLGESIELTTLDRVVDELKLDRLDVIKMDIEGSEVRALKGARRTLGRFRPALAVATEHTDDMMKNNRDVIATVREIAPFYRVRCGSCLPGNEIIPEALYFVTH
jgi:FkbM family methyltransferase